MYENEDIEIIAKSQKKRILGIFGVPDILYLFLTALVVLTACVFLKIFKSQKINLIFNISIGSVIWLFLAILIFPSNMANKNLKIYHKILFFLKHSISKKKYSPRSTQTDTKLITSIVGINSNSLNPNARSFVILGDELKAKIKSNGEEVNGSKVLAFGITIEGIDFSSQSDDRKRHLIGKLNNLLRLTSTDVEIVKYITPLNTNKQSQYAEELKEATRKSFKKKEIPFERYDKIIKFLDQVCDKYDEASAISHNFALFFIENNEEELVNQVKVVNDTLEGIKFRIMSYHEVIGVYQKMLTPWEIDFDKGKVDEAIEANNLKEFLSFNDDVIFARDHVLLNDTYYKFVGIVDFPQEVGQQWLDNIIFSTANVTMRMRPMSAEQGRSWINQNLKNIKTSFMNSSKDDEFSREELLKKNEYIKEFTDSILDGGKSLFKFGIYFLLQSDSLEGLEKEYLSLYNLVSASNMVLDPFLNRQLDGMSNYMLKSNKNTPDYSNVVVTSQAIALSYPFTNNKLDHEFGADLGQIVSTGDRFVVETFHPTGLAGQDYINNHELGFGATGSGKTWTIILKIFWSLIEGNYTIVLDPDNEFLNISKNLKANMIDLAAPTQVLNPFDIIPPVVQDEIYQSFEEEKKQYKESHLNKLEQFHSLLFPDWDTKTNVFLTKMISSFYTTWKPWINIKNLQNISPNASPTYSDLIKYMENLEPKTYKLNNEEFKEIYTRFSTVFINDGIYQSKLNAKSTIVFDDNKLVVFHLKTLLDSGNVMLKNALMRLLFSFINTHVTKMRYINDSILPDVMKEKKCTQNETLRYLNKTFIIIDECHKLWINNPVSKLQIFDWYKVLRKYSAKISCWTQNITDFYGTSETEIQLTKGIFENSQYVNVMSLQTIKEVDLASELFATNSTPFTKYEKEFILTKKPGTSIFMATNTKRYVVQYEVPPLLQSIKISLEKEE